MFWGFEEWTTIATIILSVVAIVIAICSSRSTSKAANRQIAEMEKQVREIKNLSVLQIDTTIKMLEVEIQKTMAKVELSAMEAKAIDDINSSGMEHIGPYREEMMRKIQEEKAQRESQIYSDCSHNLNELLANLNQLKKKLG